MTFDEYAEAYGIEPDCSNCVYFVLGICSLIKQGIDCDGEENFTSDGR